MNPDTSTPPSGGNGFCWADGGKWEQGWVGDPPFSPDTRFSVYMTAGDVGGNAVLHDNIFTTTAYFTDGTIPDCATFRAVVYQYNPGTAAVRAGEFHAISTATRPHPNASAQAIECGIHVTQGGDGYAKTGGIIVHSDDASPIPTGGAVAADFGIRLFGSAGFLSGFVHEDTSGNRVFYTDGGGGLHFAGDLVMTNPNGRIGLGGASPLPIQGGWVIGDYTPVRGVSSESSQGDINNALLTLLDYLHSIGLIRT